MKICPACNHNYADDSLFFCLEDGSVLSSVHDTEKTQVLPALEKSAESVVTRVSNQHSPPATFQLQNPTVQSPQPTLPSTVLDSRARDRTAPEPGSGGAKMLLGVLAGIVLGVGAAGLIGAFLWFSRADDSVKSANANASSEIAKSTPAASATPERSPTTQKSATPEVLSPTPLPTLTPRIEKTATPDTPKKNVPEFGPMRNNVSLNGTNLTYYRGSTAQSCQADCARNPACKGFTFIRPGGYNAGDPAMCYLASSVSGSASHTCCISSVKR